MSATSLTDIARQLVATDNAKIALVLAEQFSPILETSIEECCQILKDIFGEKVNKSFPQAQRTQSGITSAFSSLFSYRPPAFKETEVMQQLQRIAVEPPSESSGAGLA